MTQQANQPADQPTAQRVALFGQYGVYSPYQSHDGDVGWTVQKLDVGDADTSDVNEMGAIIGEFAKREDAIDFASRKAVDNERPALSGVALIAAERTRQIVEHGYDDEHDDTHTDGFLAEAGGVIAGAMTPTSSFSELLRNTVNHIREKYPDDRIRHLAIAGALIAADIDRLNRILRKSSTTKKNFKVVARKFGVGINVGNTVTRHVVATSHNEASAMVLKRLRDAAAAGVTYEEESVIEEK